MGRQSADAALPGIARAAIAERLGIGRGGRHEDLEPALRRIAASFVTLTREETLRGCIGTLEASRPLVDDVQANAVAAAFGDSRFPPLTGDELPATSVSVSVLSPLKRLEVVDEVDLLARLRPGVDGLVLAAEGRRATFLPQVWERLTDRRDFVDQLRRKAGLPRDFWKRSPSFFRYSVTVWRESEGGGGAGARAAGSRS